MDGSTWIVGPISGTRTNEHGINTDCALSKLENFSGVKVKYMYPMTGTNTIGMAFGMSFDIALLSSVFECVEAKPIGITREGITPDSF